jgi:2OG-Fe(II) oxygenase superfamily
VRIDKASFLVACTALIVLVPVNGTEGFSCTGRVNNPSRSSTSTATCNKCRKRSGAHHRSLSCSENDSVIEAELCTHTFWGTIRTQNEIRQHIGSCLDGIEESFPAAGFDATSCGYTVDVLSAEPPLVLVHNFLSPDMCNEIIQKALHSDTMKPSTLGVSRTTSLERTSSTVWLRDQDLEHPLRLIAEKVSRIVGLHTDHQDGHNDLDGRGRLATCLVYLAEPGSGGETMFPGVRCGTDDGAVAMVSPRQGSAVFFWNTLEKPGCENYAPGMFLNVDMQMRHAGLPVTSGEKWIANRWIHPVQQESGVLGL